MPVDLRPLPARSVVLSLLLGSHPARIAPAALTDAGRHFGIADSTLRVALTRAVAAGDLERVDGEYALGRRLVDRQRRQDAAVEHASATWDGAWTMAVVVETGRPGRDRAALRTDLARALMAEWREGVWLRPDNLGAHGPTLEHDAVATLRTFPDDDPAALAATLWDLDGWAARARSLTALLAETTPADLRLTVAADIVRHIVSDPLLPASLLPTDWPGSALRETYATYQAELAALL